jgi:dephospho-CoA kinase
MIPKERIQEINEGQYTLGVIGSMGSGKTYACEQLVNLGQSQELNVHHIEVDPIRRDILGTNKKYQGIRQELEDVLDTSMLKQDGSIDKEKLNQMIFYDKDAMYFFRNVTRNSMLQAIEQKKEEKYGLILVEWAMLDEDGLSEVVNDNFLLVQCTYNKQISRLSGGDLPLNQIRARLKTQGTNKFRSNVIKLMHAIFEKGQLYTFDTTHNPQLPEYKNLLEEIALKIK